MNTRLNKAVIVAGLIVTAFIAVLLGWITIENLHRPAGKFFAFGGALLCFAMLHRTYKNRYERDFLMSTTGKIAVGMLVYSLYKMGTILIKTGVKPEYHGTATIIFVIGYLLSCFFGLKIIVEKFYKNMEEQSNVRFAEKGVSVSITRLGCEIHELICKKLRMSTDACPMFEMKDDGFHMLTIRLPTSKQADYVMSVSLAQQINEIGTPTSAHHFIINSHLVEEDFEHCRSIGEPVSDADYSFFSYELLPLSYDVEQLNTIVDEFKEKINKLITCENRIIQKVSSEYVHFDLEVKAELGDWELLLEGDPVVKEDNFLKIDGKEQTYYGTKPKTGLPIKPRSEFDEFDGVA